MVHHISPLIESGAFGAITGAVAGYAIKKIMKIGAIIIGAFFAGLMYLSYQGIVSVNWDKLNNQTQAAAQQGITQVTAVMNNIAGQIHAHGAATALS